MYCYTPKVLYKHVGGGLSSTTTSVQHLLGSDGCHRTTTPVRSPHTSYRWRRERVIEPIKWMRSPHTRAVRLIEIEIKSRFEIARFLNRFIARFFFFFFCALPQPPAVCYPNQSECSRTEQTGIQTDSMLKKQGRWVQNRIRTWWPKKCMLHAEHTAGSSDHISFRAASVFLKIPLRLLIPLSATR